VDILARFGWFVAAAGSVGVGLFATELSLVFYLLGALLFCAGVIAYEARRGALATALLCAGANGYLFSQKMSGSGPSRCNINEVLNCDVINTSEASELFGVPITLFGVAFYTGLALAAMLHERTTPKFHQVSGLFALFNLGVSAWLAWESKQLGAVCVVCITIYIGNALLLWAALKGVTAEGQKLFDQLGGALTARSSLLITATFAVVLLTGLAQWQDAASSGPDFTPKPAPTADAAPAQPDDLSRLFARPRGTVTLDGSEPVLGNKDAPYLVVEFADYGCPHCARAARDVATLVEQVPEIQVRFKVFPLTSMCNPGIDTDSGPERCLAALAAECAGGQGKYFEMSHLIFANQSHMSQDDLTYMASQIDLDMDAWNACMADPANLERVVEDAAAGVRAGVMGTPTMFLKGTHGDEFIEVRGVMGVFALVDAHRSGIKLPAPGPPRDLGM